nr:EOG090X0IGM [Polyphemus pediculus]
MARNLPGLHEDSKKPFDIKNIFDGYLLAVPTNRRSAEKRMMRKFGSEKWNNKLILPRTDLLPCNTCGHYHEKGRLCSNCYERIKTETAAMQAEMIKELGLKPVEKEVVIVYKGEKQQHTDEFFEGKKIVEMQKPRPKWFSQNLLQKSGSGSHSEDIETTTVKPHELG